MPKIISRAWATLPLVSLAALAIICAFGLLRAALTIPQAVPLDPNEGWNAYHALAAMAGHGLYPSAQSHMINNYPPLSFYLVGVLGRMLGDMIVAGRLISFAALGAVMAGIAVAARSMGCTRMQAVFAALLFADILLLTSDYVGMDDPQLLGHAIAIAGFILILRQPQKTGIVVGGAFLMTLAVFVKHNLIAMPLAAAIWLFLHDRRSALGFVLAGIGFGIAGLCAFRLTYDTELWTQILSGRAYSLSNLMAALQAWFSWAFLPMAIVAWLFRRHRGDRYVRLCVIYTLVAFAIGGIFSGGDGVDANAMFDTDIALVLCCALALNRFEAPSKQAMVALLCVLSLGLPLWQDASADALQAGYWLHPLRDETDLARNDIALLKAAKGPALCEMLSLCYWAGKTAEVDVYNVGEQFGLGARSDVPLIRKIENHGFAVMQFDSLTPFALSPGVRKAIDPHYRILRANDDGIFLVPR